jgi:hypothetical protein
MVMPPVPIGTCVKCPTSVRTTQAESPGNAPAVKPDSIFGPTMSNCSDVNSGRLNELCA